MKSSQRSGQSGSMNPGSRAQEQPSWMRDSVRPATCCNQDMAHKEKEGRQKIAHQILREKGDSQSLPF